VVHDHILLYATGGLAYASVDHTLSASCIGCAQGVNFGSFTESRDKTQVGWTVGGGAELLHDSNWLLRAEALYVDLGSENESYLITPPGGGSANADTKWDDQFWIARIGVAYKFSGPDCCAAPLK
jgi:outer membrane immunogenic protein